MSTMQRAADWSRAGPRRIAHGRCRSRAPARFRSAGVAPPARGMVTFELAIGILSASLAAVVLCWTISLVTLHIRCADAAAQVARSAARGDDAGAAEAKARAPAGATIDVAASMTSVTVTIRAQSSLGRIGPITMTGSATMPKEPT